MSEAEEREHVRLAVRGIKKLTGAPPVRWFSGRSSLNTRRLLVEHGGFLYDRDYFGDELPFWTKFGAHNHLVVPYSLETNDNRFDRNMGFSTAEEFAQYMIDCFDLMYEEGAERPKIMSLALHDRLIGRPAKAVGLIKFLDYARKRDRVWFGTGRDIAKHCAGSIRRRVSDRGGHTRSPVDGEESCRLWSPRNTMRTPTAPLASEGRASRPTAS